LNQAIEIRRKTERNPEELHFQMVLFTDQEMLYYFVSEKFESNSQPAEKQEKVKKEAPKEKPKPKAVVAQHWRKTRMNYVKRSKVNDVKEHYLGEFYMTVILKQTRVEFPALNGKSIIYVTQNSFLEDQFHVTAVVFPKLGIYR